MSIYSNVSQIPKDVYRELETYRILIVGLPRNGKTLLSIVLSYLAYLYDDIPLYANFPTSFGTEIEPSRLIQFHEGLRECNVILDEAYGLINSHFSGTNVFNEAVDFFFFQTGKRDITTFVIAQLGKRIDKDYRSLADFIVLSEKLEGGFLYSVYSGMTKVNEFGFNKEFASQFYNMYNSKEIIMPLTFDRSKIDFDELKMISEKMPNKQSFVTYVKAKPKYRHIKGDKLNSFYALIKIGLEEEAKDSIIAR